MLSCDKSVEAAKFKPVGLKPANVLNVVNTVKQKRLNQSRIINPQQVSQSLTQLKQVQGNKLF